MPALVLVSPGYWLMIRSGSVAGRARFPTVWRVARCSRDTVIGTRENSMTVDWVARAACRKGDPDALFVQGAAQNRAKLVCMGCPVRTECLADALDHRVEFGVWGGMTERERRALLRRRPEVESWRTLLDSARRRFDPPLVAEAV